jgi:hypothetical protein
MSISGVTDATSVVPLLDPSQGVKATNAGPASKTDNDNDNDVKAGTKVPDKASLAPGTGKLFDKTV